MPLGIPTGMKPGRFDLAAVVSSLYEKRSISVRCVTQRPQRNPEIFRIADDLYSDKRAIQLTQSWLDSALTSSVDRREVFKLITTGFRS